jgi:hypothetical protein
VVLVRKILALGAIATASIAVASVALGTAPRHAGAITIRTCPAGKAQAPYCVSVVKCKVPNVVGLTRRHARRRLLRAGCSLGGILRREHAHPGRIFKQHPRHGGNKLRPVGYPVNVTIAT